MRYHQRQGRKNFRDLWVIIVFYIILGLVGIGCPIRFFTGISCAGCGMTRAWIALFQADLSAAFYYHPLFWAPALAVVLLLARPSLNRYVFWIGIGMLCAGFMAVYFIRLFFSNNGIVTFEPSQGVIWKLIIKISRELK